MFLVKELDFDHHVVAHSREPLPSFLPAPQHQPEPRLMNPGSNPNSRPEPVLVVAGLDPVETLLNRVELDLLVVHLLQLKAI